MPEIDRDGVAIHYETHGPGNDAAPAMILVISSPRPRGTMAGTVTVRPLLPP